MNRQHDFSTNGRKSVDLAPLVASNENQDLSRVYSARLPTVFGEFQMTVYHDHEGKEHVALVMGEMGDTPMLVRIHSECLTGDVFSSVRCDCRDQLHSAMQRIMEEGRGVLVYLRQEGRGIGLTKKIQAYALQDEGLDTVDANLHLGLPVDNRDYGIAASILRREGATRVRLLTNNPRKIADLEADGIEVVERVPLQIPPRPDNQRYLRTKASKLGHLFGDSLDRTVS